MKERLDFIDIAKGILIVLVVVGHVWQSGPVFDTIYAFHMPGFFIIGGMLLGVSDFASTPFGTGMIILVGTLLIEIPIVYVVNRWLPFLMGKPRRRNAAVS